MPLVSVIMPAYNRSRCIGASIDSVLAQDLSDLELVVVDDGSTDDTAAVVASLGDTRLRYLATPHRGVTAARNAGIEHSRGEYLAFCDSDDRLLPGALTYLLSELRADTAFTGVYGDAYWENIQCSVPSIEARHIPYVQGVSLGALMVRNGFATRFDDLFCNGFEDWDFLLRLRSERALRHCPRTVIEASRSQHDHIMGDKSLEHLEILYVQTFLRHLPRILAGSRPWLVILHCSNPKSGKPPTYIAANHLRLFFPHDFMLAFETGLAHPDVQSLLASVAQHTFTDEASLRMWVEQTPCEAILALRDDTLVTPLFGLHQKLEAGVRHMPRIVRLTSPAGCRQFSTFYRPQPVILEGYTGGEAETELDPEMFLGDKAAFLAGPQAPQRRIDVELLRIPPLTKQV